MPKIKAVIAKALTKPFETSQTNKQIGGIMIMTELEKLPTTKVTGWLVSKGILEVFTTSDGKNRKRPTDIGISLGITTEHRSNFRVDYDVNLYNKQAQQFILDNLSAVLREELL